MPRTNPLMASKPAAVHVCYCIACPRAGPDAVRRTLPPTVEPAEQEHVSLWSNPASRATASRRIHACRWCAFGWGDRSARHCDKGSQKHCHSALLKPKVTVCSLAIAFPGVQAVVKMQDRPLRKRIPQTARSFLAHTCPLLSTCHYCMSQRASALA